MLRLAGARWGHSQCSVRGCISYAVEQVAARPRPTGRVAAPVAVGDAAHQTAAAVPANSL